MKCPKCSGRGAILVFNPGYPAFPCSICEGSGKLPDNIDYDIGRGKVMQASRLKDDLSLREYCKKHSVSAITRSEQEQGFFRR